MIDPVVTRLNIDNGQRSIRRQRVFRRRTTGKWIRQASLFIRQKPIALRSRKALSIVEQRLEMNGTSVRLEVHPFVVFDATDESDHR